jgi:hypothetical protein
LETTIITSPRRLPGRASDSLGRRLDALLIERLADGERSSPAAVLVCAECRLEAWASGPAETGRLRALHARTHRAHVVRRSPAAAAG